MNCIFDTEQASHAFIKWSTHFTTCQVKYKLLNLINYNCFFHPFKCFHDKYFPYTKRRISRLNEDQFRLNKTINLIYTETNMYGIK